MENVQIILDKELLKVIFKKENFYEQWKDWTRKLQKLSCLYKGKPEVFFLFPSLEMNVILTCLNEIQDDCIVVGYQNQNFKKKEFKIIHRKIRGGEELIIEEGALIVGDVEKDVNITLNKGNLYIMGILKGRVQCLDERSQIICQKMEEAKISLQGIWQISTRNESLVYYDKVVHQIGGVNYGKKNHDNQW